eukprot:scaffold90529_cov22-Prasinocladus_malaysianus.AAC.1
MAMKFFRTIGIIAASACIIGIIVRLNSSPKIAMSKGRCTCNTAIPRMFVRAHAPAPVGQPPS